jgi:hypothetical protein
VTHPTAQIDGLLPAGPQLRASDNQYSTVYQAAGDINLHQHPTLSTLAVTEAEISAVRRAWVKVDQRGHRLTTAPRVLELLRQDEPIVVISGRRGTGKTAAALRALTDPTLERSTPGPTAGPLFLEHVLPDWDAPDKDLLPHEPGRGYLLDVSGEHWPDPAAAAKQILGHANVLRQKGSRLIVLTGEAAWPAGRDPQMGRVAVAATAAPRGDLVLERHLNVLYPDPAKHGWLHAAAPGERGSLADLLRPDMPPADAAGLAVALSRIDGTDPDALGTARATMLGWHDLVRTTFTNTEGKADDRALLLAAIILDGHSQGDVLKAARRLLRQDEARNISDILTAPGLATRLENVQAKVDGQHVSFRHLPGYSAAQLGGERRGRHGHRLRRRLPGRVRRPVPAPGPHLPALGPGPATARQRRHRRRTSPVRHGLPRPSAAASLGSRHRLDHHHRGRQGLPRRTQGIHRPAHTTRRTRLPGPPAARQRAHRPGNRRRPGHRLVCGPGRTGLR